MQYLRIPDEIYRQSFARVEAESDLSRFPKYMWPIIIRIIHASGMPEITSDICFSDNFYEKGQLALRSGSLILCDCKMVQAGIMSNRLRWQNPLRCILDAPNLADKSIEMSTTRSAAAMDLIKADLQKAIVVIGNAPTALFRLLELIDETGIKPAAIVGLPVGFVGAAESKAELASQSRNVPFITLLGRRGGSAMAAAVLNALILEAAV